jgi:hypothetical protein
MDASDGDTFVVGELDAVLVQVVELRNGREIGWGQAGLERLRERLGDVKAAIVAGGEMLVASLPDLPSAERWALDEVSATFGVTLTAEAGVVLSRVSTEGSFAVTITYRHRADGQG